MRAVSSPSIRFRLRRPDRVSVEIVDSRGDVVSELARDRPQGRRFAVYVWDGRDDAGRVVGVLTFAPSRDGDEGSVAVAG